MDQGFVTKYSKRLVQKMAHKTKDLHYVKGAYVTDQQQRGHGKNIFFQTIFGKGFANDIFPGNQPVIYFIILMSTVKIIKLFLHLLINVIGNWGSF